MTIKNTVICAVATAFTLTNAALSASPQEAAAHKAHDSYLAAINSNDLDAFLEALLKLLIDS